MYKPNVLQSRANYNNYAPPWGDAPTHPDDTLYWAEGSPLSAAANGTLGLLSVCLVRFVPPSSLGRGSLTPGSIRPRQEGILPR